MGLSRMGFIALLGVPAPHPTLCLWVKTRALTSMVQLLTTPSVGASQTQYGGAGRSEHQTLVAATSSTVAAALGFSRQQRDAYFIQQCLFRHIRRYLLVLEAGVVGLRLVGALPRLRVCWQALTRPTMELFNHPLTGELLLDIRITRQQLKKLGSVQACFDLACEPSNWIESERVGVSAQQLRALKDQCVTAAERRLRSAVAWQRYWLTWGRAWVFHGVPHSVHRQRRARSIKRRHVKRLVKATQYRF
jgi:hypothetical protein